MTQTMKLQSESDVHTRASASPYIKSTGTLTFSGREGQVIYREFPQVTSVATPDGCVDIDKFISEVSQDKESAALISEGRRWVADALLKDEPESLKRVRLSKGLSQAQLADMTGTSQAHIARLENGVTEPQVSTVLKLAKALGIKAEELFLIIVGNIDSDSVQKTA